MNLILAIPMEVRLAALFMLGVCVGSLANLGAYRLAWHPRPISPWSGPHPNAPPRRWVDHLPIVGWLWLRREAGLHGRGFWIRPLLVELLSGVAFAALYWWEISELGLLPPGIPRPVPPSWIGVLHMQCAAHLLLISLMFVASLIDIDEKIIPDSITVPGTLLGLLLAAACPRSLLPNVVQLADGRLVLDFLRLTSPGPWPRCLAGFPHIVSILTGLGCWWLWCAALLPRSWYSRRGWRRAFQLAVARLLREQAAYRILVLGLLGSAAIAGVWFAGGRSWSGLLSALVGMAAGGGIIWLVRIIGTTTLKREAMGFGDVTLMTMIGTFLGWQTCLIIFFLAPFAGLIVGLFQVILFRRSEIFYGPFLCLAAAAVIVRWASVWNWAWAAFAIGWLVPLVMFFCMALLAVLLGLWQLIRGAFR